MHGQGDQAHTRMGRSAVLWILVGLPSLSIGGAPLDSLTACAQLTADAPRLACFDREIAEIGKSGEGLSKSSDAAPTPEQRFGFADAQARALQPKPAPASPSAEHARIVSVSEGANGRRIFLLDNSQIWQQIELERDFSVRAGQPVTISNGALGSFWLSSDSHRATRVKRVR